MAKGTVIQKFRHKGGRYLLMSWSQAHPLSLAELTPSECEVAMAWIEGMSAKTLARKRKVSPRTICNQIRAIYQKIGVSSREELLGHVQRSLP